MQKAHGVIEQTSAGQRTDYLFRVSLKGYIRSSEGKVLVVKEEGRTWWDLPGGGMDHHESIKDSIARELAEEVNLTGDFTYQIMVVEEPGTLKRINAWQIRLVFEILPTNATFEPGKDGDEICFIDPAELKDSSHSSERKIYEYSLLKPARS